jgi:hypothetical protein
MRRFCIVVVALLLISGCATTPAPTAITPVSETPPPHVAGATPHFYCQYKEYQEGPRSGKACGYVNSIRGFDKSLFKGEPHDVTTAHFTFCSDYGPTPNDPSTNTFRAVFYYHPNPTGSFDRVDSLTDRQAPDVQVLGGDVSDPYPIGDKFVPQFTTRIDRAVEAKLLDGTSVLFPAPIGTRWAVITKESQHPGMWETWTYRIPE